MYYLPKISQTPIIMPNHFANFILQRLPPKASSKQMNKITNRKIIQITFVCSKTIDVISISSDSDSDSLCQFPAGGDICFVFPRSATRSARPFVYCFSGLSIHWDYFGVLTGQRNRMSGKKSFEVLPYGSGFCCWPKGMCVTHTNTHTLAQSKTAEKEMTGYQNC